MARTSKKWTEFWPLTLNCDIDLGVRVMKAVCNTPSSDGVCVYNISLNYLERIKSYGPDKQKLNRIWPLTLNCDRDVRVMKAVRDTPSSDGACVYEISLNYLERIKSYGPDKQQVNGHTDGHTDNPRHTIIRPVDDRRIKIQYITMVTNTNYMYIKPCRPVKLRCDVTSHQWRPCPTDTKT
jgi:hypothetical protein